MMSLFTVLEVSGDRTTSAENADGRPERLLFSKDCDKVFLKQL